VLVGTAIFGIVTLIGKLRPKPTEGGHRRVRAHVSIGASTHQEVAIELPIASAPMGILNVRGGCGTWAL